MSTLCLSLSLSLCLSLSLSLSLSLCLSLFLRERENRTYIHHIYVTRSRYSDWEASRRQIVEEAGGGRIGYIHVRSTSGSAYTGARSVSVSVSVSVFLSLSVSLSLPLFLCPPPLSQHIWLYADFARQFFPVFDKEALIIDVRHNSGGNQGVSLSRTVSL